ncbi:MAG: DNA-binding protein [Deltaproteobacteria bacterium]|nr:DNA-binding protein [Deltaproteobacteria bacterium]
MDRLFLDANVLFSAAYRPDARVRELWRLKGIKLVTSLYAVEEARRNLDRPEQREKLEELIGRMEVLTSSPGERRLTIDLPQKDRPILLGAIESKGSHLITGDFTHFGRYFGKTVEGVLILTPSDYLRARKKK